MQKELYTQLVGLKTLVSREMRRIIRIWPQTLLPPVVTMFLYFVIFGNLIGDKIGDMNNLPYINFLTPGLIMMSIINNAYVNVSSSFFSAKFQNSIEELIVSPMSSHAIIWGYILGGIFRGFITGSIVLVISLFFTTIHIKHVFLTIFLAFLTAMLFSLAGIVNGIFAKKFDDISIVPTFILTPLTYLGGVFYSTSLLPVFWQKVSLINPILYIINGFRYALFGTSDINLNISLTLLIGFVSVLYFTAWYLFKQGISLKR
jgi:ABC-2 type transport system permease protein